MKLFALLLSFQSAFAQDPLQFSARIQNEALAEEAIDLLHCLSEQLEMPWELGEGNRASHRLTLREKNSALEGAFTTPAGETAITLGRGEAHAVCAKLAPKLSLAPDPDLPEKNWETLDSPMPKRWLWAAAAAAAVAGGFLFWKSRQPDHRGFRMN
jgi:hypothetical protein